MLLDLDFLDYDVFGAVFVRNDRLKRTGLGQRIVAVPCRRDGTAAKVPIDAVRSLGVVDMEQIIDTLKKGIKLYVNGAKYDADGVLWYEVSTTCRKDGWVLADSVGFEEQADARYDSMLGSIGSLLSGGSSYIGNVKTHVYHLPGCRVLPNPENRTYFENKRQAEREGYRACGVCKP